MLHLFEIVPSRFFSILSSPSRDIYANILFYIYYKLEENNSYTLLKEDFINIVEEYLNKFSNQDIVIDNEFELKGSRDKSNYIFRNLKQCGWIDTEYGKDQQQYVNLEDYAITFLNVFSEFEANNNLELSSYIYRMYQGLYKIEYDRAYLTIKDTINQSESLIKRLSSLNSNVKKYIKRITKLDKAEKKDQLQEILNQLLGEYKEKIIDNAYYYMKANDNPNKYKSKFIQACNRIENENIYSDAIVEQIMKEDNIKEKDSAEEIFYEYMSKIKRNFDRIIDIVDEIDNKNAKYISVAIERIKMLMNNDSNLEGQLIEILKNYILLGQENIEFSLYDTKNIVPNSLYSPRVVNKVEEVAFKEPPKRDESLEQELLKQLSVNVQFGKKAITKYINKKLSINDKLTIHDFNVENKDEFIKLILAFVYSIESICDYKVKWENDYDVIGKVRVPKFTIERGDKSE